MSAAASDVASLSWHQRVVEAVVSPVVTEGIGGFERTSGSGGRRLRVLLDGRMFVGRFAGVSRYVSSLVDHLSRDNSLALSVLCGDSGYEWLEAYPGVRMIGSTFGKRDRRAFRRWMWEELRLPGIIRRSGVDVFHATWNSGIGLRCGVPSILTLHDLIPWRDPSRHFYYSHDSFGYRMATSISVRRAHRVVGVSGHSVADICARFAKACSKTVAIPNGVDLPCVAQEALSRRVAEGDEAYVLYVGGLGSRKNIAGLLSVMSVLWERHGLRHRLLLTGNPSGLPAEAIRELDRLTARTGMARRGGETGANLRDRVEFLGHVDDRHLARLYAGASALVTMSRDEGFGLPVLEAMAYGCPVVASACGALPEVVGSAGRLVDPDSPAAAADVLAGVLGDVDLRSVMAASGRERARGFSWSSAARRLSALYREVAFSRGVRWGISNRVDIGSAGGNSARAGRIDLRDSGARSAGRCG